MAVTAKPVAKRSTLLVNLIGVAVLAVLAAVAVFIKQYQGFQASRLRVPETGLVYEISAGSSLSRLAHDLHHRASALAGAAGSRA